jgi:hypothetical protein
MAQLGFEQSGLVGGEKCLVRIGLGSDLVVNQRDAQAAIGVSKPPIENGCDGLTCKRDHVVDDNHSPPT